MRLIKGRKQTINRLVTGTAAALFLGFIACAPTNPNNNGGANAPNEDGYIYFNGPIPDQDPVVRDADMLQIEADLRIRARDRNQNKEPRKSQGIPDVGVITQEPADVPDGAIGSRTPGEPNPGGAGTEPFAPRSPQNPSVAQGLTPEVPVTRVVPRNFISPYRRRYYEVAVKIYPLNNSEVPNSDPLLPNSRVAQMSLENAGGLKIIDTSTQQEVLKANKIDLLFSQGTLASAEGQKLNADGRYRIIPVTTERPTTIFGLKVRSGNQDGVISYEGDFVMRCKRRIQVGQKCAEWLVINIVDLDDYVASVTASEIIPSWLNNPKAKQAIRAQSVAARSYVLTHMATIRQPQCRERSGKTPEPNEMFTNLPLQSCTRDVNADQASSERELRSWDVLPTTNHQSYMGVTPKIVQVREWIKDIQDMVVIYNNRVALTAYSANSGGYTCSNTDCWRSRVPQPYLQPVRDHDKVRSPEANGVRRPGAYRRVVISQALVHADLGQISDDFQLTVATRNSSQRVNQLGVVASSGNRNLDTQKTTEVLRKLGWEFDRYFEIVNQNRTQLVLQWFGWGHGVGMSQWGAYYFATEDGLDYVQILQKYYKGTRVENLLQFVREDK